ncbi:hypothetical protein ACFL96_16240 [Thermoproteota archaeon]
MQVKEIVAKVQNSAVFKQWYQEHDSAYLAHVFFMEAEDGKSSYDVGYYLKSEDRMASFGLDKDVEFRGFSEVFKKPEATIDELDLSKVDTTTEDALETAKKLQEEEYPKSKPVKRIVILQHLTQGQVWNITYVAENFKTLNIKIDAATGKIVEHKLLDLIQKAL